ncbi:hypothetical protein DD109_02510 [Clostridioides difficile]|uniref:Uncharacterized protein n=3 Tax=Clostridioides difficile TaxID=1496 RepID=Q184V7_CLOD6|nr:hypothetical protein BZ168_02515 [Clostridioides difficile]EQI90026.1 hypothetical protein QQO_3148 [Clostridioides difficile P3]EQI98717.1 hypothetical protein QQS_3288 [Clostridioides difficile P6]CAJ70013.1 conserved hypothetical protein [Clostridioides difficile 630]ARC15806.1 hypothetical protein A6J95_13580 [Clostridioides difficile]
MYMRRDNNLLMKDYKYKGYFKGVEIFDNVNDLNLNTLTTVSRFVLVFLFTIT